MNQQAFEQVGGFFRDQKLSAALFSNPATVAWLTGYAPPIQTGPSPFEGGPALGWWQGGQLTLVLSDMEAAAARSQGADVREYTAYTIDGPIAGFANQAACLKDLLKAAVGLKGLVGVELNFLPAAFLDLLREALPAAAITPLDGRFDLLRAVKTPAEVDRLRAALQLCDVAQAETRRLIRPGVSEIEVWGQLKAFLEVQAGGRLPLLADFVAGGRTAEIGGLPGGYILQEGDAVIADIVPRLDGYWGDNAGTHFVAEPAAELRKIYRIVLETLRKGIQAVKPGLRACDLDLMLRDAIQEQGYAPYPHHSGHGLGTSFHEEPRIVPYNTLALEPGMVVAVEPGIYVPGLGGVRLEDVLLVTQDGCQVLTKHLENA
jgi:Xaa-Pro dipeptidase